jgi:hypothetical protein
MPTRHQKEQYLQFAPAQETLFWLNWCIICLLCIGICGLELRHEYLGRSTFGGGPDVRVNYAMVESVSMSGDGSDLGSRLEPGTCYVKFAEGKGGLHLDDEWVDRFAVGTRYDVFFTNRSPGIDQIISWGSRD